MVPDGKHEPLRYAAVNTSYMCTLISQSKAEYEPQVYPVTFRLLVRPKSRAARSRLAEWGTLGRRQVRISGSFDRDEHWPAGYHSEYATGECRYITLWHLFSVLRFTILITPSTECIIQPESLTHFNFLFHHQRGTFTESEVLYHDLYYTWQMTLLWYYNPAFRVGT